MSSTFTIMVIKTYREAPVHPQVDRNQQDVFRKDVCLFGPAADGRVAAPAQLRIEEGVERVHWREFGVLAALDQQVHVKVDHLRDWRRKVSMNWTTAQQILPGSSCINRAARYQENKCPEWLLLVYSFCWRIMCTHFIVQPVEVA